MTVEPGEGGQKLILDTVQKIKDLFKYREKKDLNYLIEADGGINTETATLVKEAGADILVCGTAIINSENFSKAISEIKK